MAGKISEDAAADPTVAVTDAMRFATEVGGVQKAPSGLAIATYVFSKADTDGALASNSDTHIPSQKAVKTYVDGQIIEGTWTPTYSPASGAFTGATITLNAAVYQRIGNWVRCSLDFTLTALGSGSPAGALSVSLPIAPASRGYADGFEQAVTGAGVRGIHAATASLSILFLTGLTVIATGNRIIISNIQFKV